MNDLSFKRTALNIWVDQLKNENVCSIFIRFHPLFQIDTSLWEEFGELVYHGETVTIHLNQKPDLLWRDTRKDHKRDIKNWIKNGGEIVKDDNFQHYNEFQELYLKNMIKLNATSDYFFSSHYFEGLKKALNTKLHLFFATINGQLISGALFTDTGGILQYHLSGTDPNFVHLHPSKPILHFVRLWGKEKGLNVFHLGGGVGAEHSGLFEFKAGFSKSRNQFHTWRCVLEENIYRKLISQQKKSTEFFVNDEIDTKGFFPAYRKPST